MTTTVLAAHDWTDNGHLIADVAQLGYLRPTDRVIDATFGRGVFWSVWRPASLTTHDLAQDGVDCRRTPHSASAFEVFVLDLPYVSIGGRKGSAMKLMHDRYGQIEAPRSPAGVQAVIDGGMAEGRRILVPGGIMLVKTQNYISSGKYFPSVYYTQRHAIETLGCTQLDQFEMWSKAPRPQPGNRTRKGADGERIPSVQHHARNNLSVLLVFRTPK